MGCVKFVILGGAYGGVVVWYEHWPMGLKGQAQPESSSLPGRYLSGHNKSGRGERRRTGAGVV